MSFVSPSKRSGRSDKAAASQRSKASLASQHAATQAQPTIGDIISRAHSASEASCSDAGVSTRSKQKKRDAKLTAKVQASVNKAFRSSSSKSPSSLEPLHSSARDPPSKAAHDMSLGFSASKAAAS